MRASAKDHPVDVCFARVVQFAPLVMTAMDEFLTDSTIPAFARSNNGLSMTPGRASGQSTKCWPNTICRPGLQSSSIWMVHYTEPSR